MLIAIVKITIMRIATVPVLVMLIPITIKDDTNNNSSKSNNNDHHKSSCNSNK